MKKVILSIVVALLGIVSVNAQFYVTGALGYSSSNTKTDDGGKLDSHSFTIAPAIGYYLNDKLEIGLSVVEQSTTSQPIMTLAGVYVFTETKTQMLSVAPYLRYSVFKFNKFSVLGSVSIYAGKGKIENKNASLYSGATETTKQTETVWGASIYPTLRYDLSNKIAIFSHLTFLQLGYSQTKIEDGHTTNNFDFIANATDIVPAIGVMYKF
ncbi:MAG: porin family protein [Candidatus Symbiothrix sp.]|jgi:hypothetical protein|nr:porin family protein [Candidatus Symbiothrix sp.]